LSDELIGLIPAAGKGLRLGLPYPKELYPIIHDNRYKPVSQYILENLTASGVEHIVFVINDTKHQLIGYFGDGSRFGCHISYVVQEVREDNQGSTSPGLAHALDAAYHLVRGKTVLFGMADTIISPKNVFEVILNKSDPADEVILGLFYTPRPEKGGWWSMRSLDVWCIFTISPARRTCSIRGGSSPGGRVLPNSYTTLCVRKG
jgi:glucose-1-phosphate thymidylyltransferase